MIRDIELLIMGYVVGMFITGIVVLAGMAIAALRQTEGVKDYEG